MHENRRIEKKQQNQILQPHDPKHRGYAIMKFLDD